MQMAVCLPRFATRSSSLHVLAESIEKKYQLELQSASQKGGEKVT